jgi:hypothetical protein
MSRLADIDIVQFFRNFGFVQADLFIVQPDGPVDGAEIELIND